MQQWGKKAEVVGLPSTMAGALEALETQQPDLVIVDYDDKTISRDEFLNQFVTGESPMKVVLVSLDAAGQVVVFDRKRLTSSQAEDWLSNPWPEDFLPE
jgi:cytochrome c oxidase subunit 2